MSGFALGFRCRLVKPPVSQTQQQARQQRIQHHRQHQQLDRVQLLDLFSVKVEIAMPTKPTPAPCDFVTLAAELPLPIGYLWLIGRLAMLAGKNEYVASKTPNESAVYAGVVLAWR